MDGYILPKYNRWVDSTKVHCMDRYEVRRMDRYYRSKMDGYMLPKYYGWTDSTKVRYMGIDKVPKYKEWIDSAKVR